MSAYTAEWLFGYLMGSGVTALVMLRGRRFLSRQIKSLRAQLDQIKQQAVKDAARSAAEIEQVRSMADRHPRGLGD